MSLSSQMPVEEIERGNMLSSFIATVDTQIEQSQFGHKYYH